MVVESRRVTIEPFRLAQWPQVARVYAEGIETGHATFETEIPDWERWDASHLEPHRFVALQDGEVVGWVAVRAVSSRCVYGGVVEHSVYVSASKRGTGIGRALLEHLIASTESAGIWTIQTGVFPENEASLRLHELVGFRVVGRRERIGNHRGVWRDVMMLERRSDRVG